MAKRKNRKGAKNELFDVEVEEVSVVDRPANKRPFIFVKREGQEHDPEDFQEVEKTGAETLLEVLGLSLPEEIEEEATEVEEVELGTPDAQFITDQMQELTKQVNLFQEKGMEACRPAFLELAKRLEVFALEFVGFAQGVEASEPEACLKEATGILLKASMALKKEEEGVDTQEVADSVYTASFCIQKAVGLKEEEQFEIRKGRNLAAAMNRRLEALAPSRKERAAMIKQLAKVADLTPNTIRHMLRADINCAPIHMLKNWAKVLKVGAQTLISASRKDGCTFKQTSTTKAEGSSVEETEAQVEFWIEGEEDSPDRSVVFKSGAKMQRLRLRRFREVVTELTSILKELEGTKEMADSQDPKKTEEVTKQEGATEGTTPPTETLTSETKPEVPAGEVPAVDMEAFQKAIQEAVVEGFKAAQTPKPAALGEPSSDTTEESGTLVEKKLDALLEKVEAVEKRVGAMEGINPGSNSEERREPVKKKAPGKWDNVLGSPEGQ